MRLLQGKKDDEVPWDYAEQISVHVATPSTNITYRPQGDHRLSTPEDLEILGELIEEFL
jgi:esterase/lipase